MKTLENNEVKFTKEQMENFLKQYPKVVKLAESFKQSPENLINFFIEIGETAISQSGNIIIDEIHADLKNFLASKDVDKVLLSVQRVSNLFTEVKKLRDNFIK